VYSKRWDHAVAQQFVIRRGVRYRQAGSELPDRVFEWVHVERHGEAS